MLRLLTIVLLLSSCGDERPPSPTAQESEQLNAAEDLLDAEAVNATGPEDRSSGPAQ
jgi:hypothetical protein